jgi:Flp pilus assembly protein TadD
LVKYDLAIRLNRRFVDALQPGRLYDLGQNDRAIKDCSEVIRLSPKDAEAHYNRGNAYRRLGQRDRATGL